MNMRKSLPLLLMTALALSACGVGKQKSLDEFAVARNAPLVIPPDYSLTPPVAGTVSLSAESAQGQAIDTLFGSPAQRSATETSVLDAAGRDRVSTGIRSTAGDPATNVVDKGATTRDIIAAPPRDGTEATTPTPQ
jgi:Protein of unknown function (DUF3035)